MEVLHSKSHHYKPAINSAGNSAEVTSLYISHILLSNKKNISLYKNFYIFFITWRNVLRIPDTNTC